jgi:leader peptidase (prepilin peptidase)/N-methyltransferase
MKSIWRSVKLDYFFIGLLGLVIGSFLNVCIYRIPKEESIIFPASHCTKCNHKLSGIDMIPVFSYLLLKGRCRYCGDEISPRYLSIECLNSLLYLIIYFKFGLTLITLKYCVLVSILIVIGMIDYDTQFVFTNITRFGALVGVVFIIVQAIFYKNGTADLIMGGLIGFCSIGIIVFITKGMGTGDIEIATICGLFLGIKGVFLGLFLAIIMGGIIGVIVLCLKIKKGKEKIAFGPFIAMGSFIAMVWSNEILNFYWNLFS